MNITQRWITGTILSVLKHATRRRPVKRADLVEIVQADMQDAYHWSRRTTQRRVNEAIELLAEAGWPVVNEGRGFFIAQTWTDVQSGLKRRHETAMSLLVYCANVKEAFRQKHEPGLFRGEKAG